MEHRDIRCFNIEENIKQIKRNVFTKKRLLSELLNEKELLLNENPIKINDWLAKEIIRIEANNNNAYVYWVAGGLSWNNWWFNRIGKILNEEEDISMLIANYDFRYIFYEDEKLMKDKIKTIYDIVFILQALLLKNKLNTTIKTTNFNYDANDNFIEGNKSINKKTYNIKLILNEIPDKQGGAKIRKRRLLKKKARPLFNLLRQINPEKIHISADDYYNYRKELLNKIVVEFTFELFNNSGASMLRGATDLFNIELFKKTYLLIPTIPYNDGDDYYTIKGKLNKLNEIGLLTYSYLNTSDKDQNLGLNIDLYRQKLYIEQKFKNNAEKIAEHFRKEILDNYYKVFKNTNFFNIFFIEKIRENINKYSAINGTYEKFIDYVERWLMSIFRPAINSFIIEINYELYKKYKIKLFIAGGDAMRRYNYNISSTKDIDTKLYIKNIKEISGSEETYDNIKIDVKEIIVRNIVKLRNYLENTFRDLFKITTIEINERGEKIIKVIDYSNTPVVFTNTKGENFKLFFVSQDKQNQHFRTREIKKSEKFPVDLFSIDYNATIQKVNEKTNMTKDNVLNISLLDVVLQEDDYNEGYCTTTNINNISIASLNFLQYDLENTYSIEDRAIARISSGKYIKDIQRYKTLCSDSPSKPAITPYNFTDASNLIQKVFAENNKEIETKFYIIIYKLEENLTFNIFDVLICIQLIPYLKQISIYEQLTKLIEDIAYFKVNIYNENLNAIIPNNKYSEYKIENDTNIINNKYLALFEKLVFLTDGEQKHYINYNNEGIIRLLKKYSLYPTPSRSAPRVPRQSTSKTSRSAFRPATLQVSIPATPQSTYTTRSGRKVLKPT